MPVQVARHGSDPTAASTRKFRVGVEIVARRRMQAVECKRSKACSALLNEVGFGQFAERLNEVRGCYVEKFGFVRHDSHKDTCPWLPAACHP